MYFFHWEAVHPPPENPPEMVLISHEWEPRAPDLPLQLPMLDHSAALEDNPLRTLSSLAHLVGVPGPSNCVRSGHFLGETVPAG